MQIVLRWLHPPLSNSAQSARLVAKLTRRREMEFEAVSDDYLDLASALLWHLSASAIQLLQ